MMNVDGDDDEDEDGFATLGVGVGGVGVGVGSGSSGSSSGSDSDGQVDFRSELTLENLDDSERLGHLSMEQRKKVLERRQRQVQQRQRRRILVDQRLMNMDMDMDVDMGIGRATGRPILRDESSVTVGSGSDPSVAGPAPAPGAGPAAADGDIDVDDIDAASAKGDRGDESPSLMRRRNRSLGWTNGTPSGTIGRPDLPLPFPPPGPRRRPRHPHPPEFTTQHSPAERHTAGPEPDPHEDRQCHHHQKIFSALPIPTDVPHALSSDPGDPLKRTADPTSLTDHDVEELYLRRIKRRRTNRQQLNRAPFITPTRFAEPFAPIPRPVGIDMERLRQMWCQCCCWQVQVHRPQGPQAQLQARVPHPPDLPAIGVHGIGRLVQILRIGGLLEFDFRYFFLMWRMGCDSRFRITKEEFAQGFWSLGVDCWEGLSARLAGVRRKAYRELPWTSDERKKFCVFVFRFMLDSEMTRVLEIGIATKVLWCLMEPIQSPFLRPFIRFVSGRYKFMNLDQLKIFHDFSTSINPDFSNYDISEAWPTMYDEFYLWFKEDSLMDVSEDNPSGDDGGEIPDVVMGFGENDHHRGSGGPGRKRPLEDVMDTSEDDDRVGKRG